jgi:hypothetical protein
MDIHYIQRSIVVFRIPGFGGLIFLLSEDLHVSKDKEGATGTARCTLPGFFHAFFYLFLLFPADNHNGADG